MKPKDWTLLVIAAAQPNPLQPVHLQKTLFLLGRKLTLKQLQVKKFYRFEPYDYGPFCAEIYADTEALMAEGLVHIDQPAFQSYRLYSVTRAGIVRAETLRAQLNQDVRGYLDRLVAWARPFSFNQLVSAIYGLYPDMKVNSVFQE